MKKCVKIISLCLCFTLAIPFAACGQKEQPSESLTRREKFWTAGEEKENEAFTSFTKRVFQKAYANDMLNLHFTVKEPENYGIERPAMDLMAESDFDDQAILDELNAFDFNALSRENQITYSIIKEDLTDSVSWRDIPPLESSFSYANGLQTNLVTFATEYEFFIEQDIKDYLDMMNQIPECFATLLSEEAVRVEEGYGYPDFLLDEIISQFSDVSSEGEESCFISAFDERVDAFNGVSDSQKRAYKEENKAIVLEKVFPAYEETAKALAAFKGKGSLSGSLSDFGEEGKAYYEMKMKGKSSYNGTVDQLYRELSEFYADNLTTFQNFVGSSQAVYNQYRTWASGKAVTPTDPVEILDFYSANLSCLFPPIADTTYSVKYLSKSIAATMPNTLAYYLIPQIDNYRNGSITVNPYAGDDADAMNTLCHEGYPGHFYQNVYFMSRDPDPVRTLFSFSGYTEGWAVYAANRAAYVYEYPASACYYYRFDEINSSLSYAMYALMDIDVHYYGKTAADLAVTYQPDEEVAEEVYRTLVQLPGVYLSYGVGCCEMYALRKKAIALAGVSFDEVEFHQFILEVGPCNFGLLFSLAEEFYQGV